MCAIIARLQTTPTPDQCREFTHHFMERGWLEQMSDEDKEAFFQRGEVLDTEFGRTVLLPVIRASIAWNERQKN